MKFVKYFCICGLIWIGWFLNPWSYATCQSLCIDSIVIDTAYNYIKNYSFEEMKDCPTAPNQLNLCLDWNRVKNLNDSPDYFHRCSEPLYQLGYSRVGVPLNSAGNQEPRSGDAYSGIVVFSRGYYQEYIQTQLKKPLLKGEDYIVGMHVSLANKSKYAGDRFTFCFSEGSNIEKKSRVYKGIIDDYLICPNPVRFKSDTFLIDTIGWMNIRAEFKSKGGEYCLTIGVFRGDIKWWERWRLRRRIFNPNWDKYERAVEYAYYYIDDVYVIRKEDYLNLMKNDDE